MILAGASLVAFIATTDAERAKTFYRDTLGLTLVEDSPFALQFDADGTMLRIQKVERFVPQSFTALGWLTADIAAAVATLKGRGIAFERFPGIHHDGQGVWTSPSGAKIAWFKDPDGNILSLTEVP